ncbi:hypothetical protein GF339_23790 [candidate division KSB3 bacterium]|uniref:Uroporphyrinogen decarboxylase (URO-D) domain-containing protein n=1 Tax=candidate division KSB3 bacterium TaxID=2044937 RepID=A0A9D5K1B0_9BACT|nr:hypothetical protein [candidate division KSB3 bacterium]MBD3327626.1 hypothetical protein [candidate division KSB3 bacterium]
MTQTYTPKERVLQSLRFEEPDRVPLDIGGINNTTMHLQVEQRLKEYLGINGKPSEMKAFNQQVVIPDERILQHFGADTRTLYISEVTPWERQPDGTYIDQWGLGYALNPDGNFYNFCSHPLSAASTLEDLEQYEFPDPRAEVMVAGLEERATALKEYCLILEGLREPIFGLPSWLRSHAEFYMDLVADEGFAAAFLDRVVDYHLQLIDFLLERLGPYLDIVKIGDDLGTQGNLIISPRTYRKLIKPRQAMLYQRIKAKSDCKLLLHSCGAIRSIIPDLIEIGVDALNPVQITAAGMEPASLKQEFGDKIAFWGGGIDTQEVLPRGTPQEVREHVKHNLERFKDGGGYVFAQVHNIMPEVPLANILAMYDAYHEFAAY